jgi:primosomal replication protein N
MIAKESTAAASPSGIPICKVSLHERIQIPLLLCRFYFR